MLGPTQPVGDPLVPQAALLPLSEPGGGYTPLEHTPSALRPFSASLGVVPLFEGKHRTTSTKYTEKQKTQRSKDGVVESDTQPIVHTDT